MKKTILILITLFISASVQASDLVTVPFVDPSRYVGVWYQMANNPAFFDRDCVCSRQALSIRKDGLLDVYNTCNNMTSSGPLREIRGKAKNLDSSTNAKFKVDFGLPTKGDYWIIALDADYRYAVVSEPSKKSLFILSRTPDMDAVLYEQAVAEAALQVDVSKLELTKHAGCTYPN